jgi:hypothetical protein
MDTVLPVTLDPAEWLELGLSSAQPLERLLALEEIAFQGLTGEFSAQLDRIASSDDAAPCRERAERLLAAHRKGQIDRKIEKVELTPERTRSLLEVGEETLKRIVQLSLRRPPPPNVLEAWRSSLLGEENAEVVCVGLTLLAKFGATTDAGIALAFTSHSSPAVVIAAIWVVVSAPTCVTDRPAICVVDSTRN